MAKRARTAKLIVDVLLGVDFVAVMSTALVEEAPHEYLGVSLFVLMIVHVVLNRRYFAHLAKGRYTPLRVVQLVAIVGLAICLIGQVASALILSKYAFSFLPALPGASWARGVHMALSYWGFLLAFAHAGVQVKKNPPTWLQAVLIAVSIFGMVSLVQLNMPAYLFGQVLFAAADYATPLAFTFVRYASVAVLFFTVFHYVRVLVTRGSR